MDTCRWKALNSELDELTNEETQQGWHFCWDWDFLLIGPGMREYEECCPHRIENEPN